MKKIIIVLLLTAILPLSAHAWYPTGKTASFDITARGGYNALENAPLASGAVAVQIFGIRTEIEVGWAQFRLPDLTTQNLCAVSAMVGYTYEFGHAIYVMAGITNWGVNEFPTTGYPTTDGYTIPSSLGNSLRGKVKVGANLFVTNHLFFNIDLSYIIPNAHHYRLHGERDGLNLTAGIGINL